MKFTLDEHPHRRWNPLLEEWVLVSPHRAKRPWSGGVEKVAPDNRPQHDPGCYLCPRNERAGGHFNPDYKATFVFDNDFAALMSAEVEDREHSRCGGLLREVAERGLCRVICFSPRHDLTLAEMGVADIRRVIDLWSEQYSDLAGKEAINAVTIFENKGAVMGCSNPHPHGQIWSNESIPKLSLQRGGVAGKYFEEKNSSMLVDYAKWECEVRERIIKDNDHFVSLVPHWAVWPFEAMILPKRTVGKIPELTDEEKDCWAEVMRDLLIRYDNIFETSFPYSMGIHQLPTDGNEYAGFQMHQHFFPPLLRSATVKKFQVGYEMSGEPQRDITAEQAAQRMRDLPEVHYKAGL